MLPSGQVGKKYHTADSSEPLITKKKKREKGHYADPHQVQEPVTCLDSLCIISAGDKKRFRSLSVIRADKAKQHAYRNASERHEN